MRCSPRVLSPMGLLASGAWFVACVLSFATADAAAAAAAAARSSDTFEALLPIKSHSLTSPYVDADLQNRYWDFGGDAIIDTSVGVRLTQDKPNQRGWLWARLPLTQRDFQITFQFAVHGSSSHSFGDGFALWLTRTRNKPGLAFGSKQNFDGLGVAFDSYANGHHAYSFPRVLALQGSKFVPYIHDQDGANLEVAGCSIPFRHAPVTSQGRLTYVDGEYLELQLHLEEWDEWRTCFEVDNYTLPQLPFLGFSAATGAISDNHEIVSVQTHSIVHKPKSHEQERAARDQSRESGRIGVLGSIRSFLSWIVAWIWFGIKLALVLGAVGSAVVYGLKMKRTKDLKRF